MPDLEPITRSEKLWSGEDLEPVTRKEMYIKHLYDETQVIPDHPVTREEMFILKAGEELHDVTIEQLTATENGTYSEQGVAYSPVIVDVPEPTLITKSITENGTYSAEDDNADGYSSVDVNVPLPQNAYLLKSVTTPTPIASFNDGEDMVMPTLKVAIEPVQSGSGDPSPTNIRPISGWDEENVSVVGKNLLDVSKSETGGIDASGNLVSGNTLWRANDYIKVKPNTVFTFSADSSLTKRAYYYDSDKNFIRREEGIGSGGFVFTTPSNCRYIKWSLFDGGNVITQAIVEGLELQIELGSTATTYEPYNGHTYTIDLDGTRYGGELDVTSGVLTVDRASIDLGTLDFVGYSASLKRAFASIPNIKYGSYSVIGINIMSSQLKAVSVGYFDAHTDEDNLICVNDTSNIIWVRLLNATKEDDYETMLSGVQLVYELATPLTIQLTPTAVKSLLGSNNVWADTGDITDAEYFSKEV